jgi:hypothetical protein
MLADIDIQATSRWLSTMATRSSTHLLARTALAEEVHVPCLADRVIEVREGDHGPLAQAFDDRRILVVVRDECSKVLLVIAGFDDCLLAVLDARPREPRLLRTSHRLKGDLAAAKINFVGGPGILTGCISAAKQKVNLPISTTNTSTQTLLRHIDAYSHLAG